MSDTGILISLEDEDAFRSSVVLDYTSRDFTAIRAQLVGLAKGMLPEWETAGEASDFGTLLIELFAYMGDVMHFYIDRTASEAFLGTALRRQSVLYIADMLGYRPIGQQAASVTLAFSLDGNAEGSLTLPVGTRVYNTTDNADSLVVFETNLEIAVNPGDVDVSVFATEGVTVRDMLLGVSQGTPSGEFVIPDKGVIFNSVALQTLEGGATVPWTFVTDLSLARPTQSAFTTFLDEEGNTHVIFGDNASGRIPPVNAQLYVTYRYGVGARANDLAVDSINSIATNTLPPDMDTFGLTVRNTASPLGGTDPESIDAMRQSIPRAASRIKSRAVTLNDYADLALQVPGVAKSVAHGTIYTAVHVRIAPQDGQADANYMAQLIQDVEAYMVDKVIVGSQVYCEPPHVTDLWQNVYIRVMVHVQMGFNRTSVAKQVEAVIRNVLSFNAVDFGIRISQGKIYRAALAVQGVEWIQLMWLDTIEPTLAQDKLMAPATGVTPAAQTIHILDIDTGQLLIPHIPGPLTIKTATVSNKALTSNVATLTTTAPHGFVVGNVIDVAGVDATFNGRYTLATIPTTTTFTYAKTAADVVSVASAGTITQVDPHAPELDTDFPGMSQDERTHDGLWVWSVGGTPGT